MLDYAIQIAALVAAAYQDARERAVDAWLIALMFLPAPYWIHTYLTSPIYWVSVTLGVLTATVLSAAGAGEGDALTVLAIAFAPHFAVSPTTALIALFLIWTAGRLRGRQWRAPYITFYAFSFLFALAITPGI